MQCDKGPSYITMDDINNLMDLYTQAVEFYNSTQQADRQKYYEHKLQNLLESPSVKKVYEQPAKLVLAPEVKHDAEGNSVTIHDLSATSPLNQFKSTDFHEEREKQERRKAKIVMQAAVHEKAKELN